jgi:hypothetical protein
MNRLVPILKSKIFIICISAIIIYTLFGFFLVPYLVRHYVPKIVHENYQKSATIGKVRFNPYVFKFEANNFRMDELDGQPILGFKQLFANFQLKSLFKWAWTFQRVAVDEPHLNAVIAPDGTLNLAQLASDSEEEKAPPKEEDESLPRLIIEHLFIAQGRIDFTDQRQSEPASINFMPLNLNIENLTTLPEEEGLKTITATTGDGESFRWTGNFSLTPLATSGRLAFENIHTATFWKFVRDSVNLEAPAGKLNITADYNLDLGGSEPKLILNQFTGALTGVILKLTDEEEPFLELPDTKIIGSSFDFIKQKGIIEKITITGGTARLAVDESGIFRLENITKSSDLPSPADHEPQVTETETKPWKINLSAFNLVGFSLEYQDASRSPGVNAGIDTMNIDLLAEVEAGGDQPRGLINNITADFSGIFAGLADTPEPEIRINKLNIDGGSYDFVPNTLTMEKISVNDGKVDLKRQADGNINLALLAVPPQKGMIAEELTEMESEGNSLQFLAKIIAVSGFETTFSDLSVQPDGPIINLEGITVVLNNVDGQSPMPFDLEMKISDGGQVRAEGMIDPALPSVQSEVEISELGLTPFQPYLDQAVSLVLKSGEVSTHGTLQYGIEEAGSQTAYTGSLKLENLHLVEPEGDETFLGWNVLQTDQVELQLEPNRVEIRELNLAQLVGKFIIYEDQTINVLKVIKNDTNSSPVSPALDEVNDSADLFPVLVHKLLLSDGQMEFADLSLTPQFGTMIHELNGVVAGISTHQDARAQVELDGQVNEYGTAMINGELNTADPKAFTNINMVFRNLEMTKLTPYSGRFAGREIESGRLSVDLEYNIRDSRLEGDNQILVERLVLGDRVQSPDAVNLPLDLAIALLEDSQGVIDIGLPVKGNLDAPEFEFGALVWKAFTNLITRMVTSPFRALGALLPGVEEETLNIIVFEPGKSTIPPAEQEKLDELANALQKRPRLKLTIQGRFNSETDLGELRVITLRRLVALHLGQDLERDEDPGPLDFSSPETVSILEAMYEAHFGPDALNAIEEELKAEEDTSKTKDPDQLAKILFDRLADVEPISTPELMRLADARAQAVLKKMSGPGGIPVNRIEIKPSVAVDRGDNPSALLDLEVAG